MKLLLDTHVWHWALQAPSRHNSRVRSLLGSQLLFGDKALHELWSFLLVSLDAFVKQHFADLGYRSLLLISDSLNVSPQSRIYTKYEKTCPCHL